MSFPHLVTGIEFGRAVVEHLGLSGGKVSADMEMVSAGEEVFGVKLNISLTADDLAAIADRMAGRTLPSPVDANLSEFLSDAPAAPTFQSFKIGEGDALVVTTDNVLSAGQRDKLRTSIRTELDSNVRILIMDRGISLAVLTGLPAAGDGAAAD